MIPDLPPVALITFAWDWAGPDTVGRVLEMLSDEDKRYLVGHDTLGSVRQAVDATAAVVAARAWSPYGVEIGGARAGLGYTGEWFDASVGLQYLGPGASRGRAGIAQRPRSR